MEITGKYVQAAVYRRIRAMAAPSDYERIYTEQQKQGFMTPCFYISEPSVRQDKQMGDYYHRDYRIHVRYFPPKGDARPLERCADMGNRLAEWLDIAGDRDWIRGREIEYHVEDDVLLLTAVYRVRMRIESATQVKQRVLEDFRNGVK